MSKQYFKLLSAQATPQDQYVTEIATLEFQVLIGQNDEGKNIFGGLRVPYFRKRTKDGGLFWNPASAGVQYHDKKNYVKMRFDAAFFAEDIETFLNERSWESRPNPNANPSAFDTPQPQPVKQESAFSAFKEQGLPF